MNSLKALQQKLAIVYFGLLFGQVSFGGVVIFLLAPQPQKDSPDMIFMIIASALLFAGITGGIIIANARLKVIREMELVNISNAYTSISIIRYALIETPVLFSIVAFLMTGNPLLMIFIGIGIGYFLLLFPSKGKLSKELNVSEDRFYN